ncbi:MAG: hypothetical protein ACOYXC_03340 [Candidatus Rifleibacteriota bacterium]
MRTEAGRKKATVLFILVFMAGRAFSAGFFDLEQIRSLASGSLELKRQFEDTARSLRQTGLEQYLKNGFDKFNELIESPDSTEKPANQNRIEIKRFLDMLSSQKFGNDGQTLSEKAGELITRIRPDLKDTDYAANPGKAVYYLLALDPKGFIENVKMIRGPLGSPMTLKEAYEYYYRVSPEKAARILILLETLKKIGVPGENDDQLEIILKAIKTNLELINESK